MEFVKEYWQCEKNLPKIVSILLNRAEQLKKQSLKTKNMDRCF